MEPGQGIDYRRTLSPRRQGLRLPRPTLFSSALKVSKPSTAFHNIYGDIHITIDDLIAEGDRVAIRWTCTMTHTGDGLGFPATRKKATVPGSSFIHCRDGKLTDGWNFMDLTKTTHQLQNK
jgi:predicted ester cyclase